MKVADIGQVLSLAELQVLKANGIEAMAPYIDGAGNPKACTAQYLRDIYAAGLKLAFFFSQSTGGSGDPGYFTTPNGVRDATWANQFLGAMRALGLVPPISDVLYVADINLDPPSLFDPYASGIDPNSGGVADPSLQTPGTYGYQALIDYARTAYPFMGKHLVQTYGRQNGVLEAWQDLQLTIQGITIDVDDATVAGWSPEGDEVTVDQLLAMLNDPKVVEKIDTFTAIKKVLADEAAAIRNVATAPDHVSDAELATIIADIGVGLEKIASKTIDAPTP